jgi:uncharacterized membrane protein
MHPKQIENSHHKEFQIERLILFSDAVFAIAITLLVIEIRVPEIAHSTDGTHDLIHALWEKFPEFFGFVLSFAVIGQFWSNHHRLFGFVKDYNGKLIWLNLLMLFWIVLVPFTSGLNSRYGNLNIVWQIYSANLAMIALSLYFLYRYIGNPKHGLSDFAHDNVDRKYSFLRSSIVIWIFTLGGLLASFDGIFFFWAARGIYFAIPILIGVVNRKHQKAKVRQSHK